MNGIEIDFLEILSSDSSFKKKDIFLSSLRLASPCSQKLCLMGGLLSFLFSDRYGFMFVYLEGVEILKLFYYGLRKTCINESFKNITKLLPYWMLIPLG